MSKEYLGFQFCPKPLGWVDKFLCLGQSHKKKFSPLPPGLIVGLNNLFSDFFPYKAFYMESRRTSNSIFFRMISDINFRKGCWHDAHYSNVLNKYAFTCRVLFPQETVLNPQHKLEVSRIYLCLTKYQII